MNARREPSPRSRWVFGVDISASASSENDPLALAVQAETLGYDFISINDHLHGPAPRFETWTLLSWIAARTSRIAVATRVLAVPYRSPLVLAKMAETLDRLTNGRLLLGLGAGASEDEFGAFGLGRATPRDRITGLEEALRIIRGAWSTGSLRFDGTIHRAIDAQLEPKPARPIPIWLGTFGPRALDITGALADGWIPSLGYAGPDRIVSMRERVLRSARRSGRGPDAITCIYNVEVRVDPGADVRADLVTGSPADVSAQLRELAQLGFHGFNFVLHGADPALQLMRIGQDILPALRASR